MGKQKMTPIGIACILLVLLVVAFMVRGSLREPEKIVLPPEPSTTEPSGPIVDNEAVDRVEVRPDTVQSAIEVLARPRVYTRTITVERYWSGGSGVSVNITGEDYTTLKMIADDLTAQIAAIPGAVDVSSTVAEQVPQVKVTADRQACSQYGLTAYSVAAAVRSGLTGTTATTVTIDNKEVDVVVRGDGRAEESLDALRSMAISTPTGGSVPLGTVGYVDCAREIFAEALEQDIKINRIVSTAGSGGTLAGLVLGAMLYGDGCKVTGVAVCDDPFEEITAELVNGAAEILGADVHVEPKDIDILRYYGAGYAQPSKEGLEAITLMAQQEGLILDPVYTGKAFAGLMHLIRTGKIGENETVLFLHSGGTASLFAVDPKDVK